MLAQSSAEAIDSLNLQCIIEWLLQHVRDRDVEIDPPVRPSWVVVLDELGEHALKIALISDEQPVETFPTRGANESLGERVGARRANWRLDDPGANRGQHLIEGPDELGISISDQELDDAPLVLERHRGVSRLLGDPAADPMLGDASQEDLAAFQVDEEQHIVPAQPDRVDVEEVQASVPVACARRNCDQVGPDCPRGRFEAMSSSTFRVLVAETVTPSFLSSPTMPR